MVAKTTTVLGVLMLSILGCDGPVDKNLDCNKICDEAEDCVGENFDKSECTEECVEDASEEKVDQCSECLRDQDSCSENLKCSVECAGVLGDVVFQ